MLLIAGAPNVASLFAAENSAFFERATHNTPRYTHDRQSIPAHPLTSRPKQTRQSTDEEAHEQVVTARTISSVSVVLYCSACLGASTQNTANT